MIINDKINIKTTNKNINHYRKLGYNITSGDVISVYPIELPVSSKQIVEVKCDICDSIKSITYFSYLRNIEKYNYYACSRNCSINKNILTNLDRYGETHPCKSVIVKTKTKKTKENRYGDENYVNIKKIKETNLDKYGCEFYMNTDEFKLKKKETMLSKYRTEHPLQNNMIKEKVKKTNLDRYGFYTPLKSEIIKNKINDTKLLKYDDSNYNNRILYKETSINKFGFDNPMKNDYIKNKLRESIKEKYGVEHQMHIEYIFNKSMKNRLKIIKYNDTELYYQGTYEKDFLDRYYKVINITRGHTIKYFYNNREHYYFSDFFIEELNLIVEIKSSKWYYEHLEVNLLKKQASIDSGYNFMFIIDKDYSLFDKLIQYKIYSSYNVCYQYKVKNEKSFMNLSNLSVSDFNFKYIDSGDKFMCNQIKNFILDYEWLGKLPNRPTHRFVAMYGDKIGAVIIMSTPNSFSKLLGDETKNIEKLISRGANAPWTPKNINSALIMWSIKWMVNNTQFRLFSAYSDPEAKELGTIYQSCNFTYLGNDYGSSVLYFDLDNPNVGWVSGRSYRKVSHYKKLCKRKNILWNNSWSHRYTMLWDNIPHEVKEYLLEEPKRIISNLIKRHPLKKHKYVYILGKDKRETKKLKNTFKELNPKLINLNYPKERGI